MNDRRTMPDPNLVDGSSPARVAVTMTDLLARPGGPRDRQLIFGDEVTVLGGANGHSYVKATRDGYVGFVTADILEPSSAPTHWVTAPATHAYEAANFKSPDLMPLSFGSRVVAIDTNAKFFETNKGFVPSQHLAPIESRAEDPLEIATLFLGTPYLWGGNSRWGLDCSGLVQAALGAIIILTTSTLNRVMVVELALPAAIPGALVGWHYAVQLSRPRWGYGSEA